MRRAPSLAALVALALVAAAPRVARAETEAELFALGSQALAKGAHGDAIDAFEALADRGFSHPDASFDRALAYLARVRANDARPGDLGRAAAAFEETLVGRPDDVEAERALEVVRAEVARKRARSGTSGAELDARPTLDRALIGLAPERVWATLALIGSALTTLGLALRRRHASSAAHLAGAIAAPIGALALVVFAALAFGARHLRVSTDDAVVVAPEARLFDDRGVPTSDPPLPEAAKVEVGDRRGELVHVRWGAVEGYAPATSLRVVRRRDAGR